MVGAFISKYLLVTTSTITVTSSAAVTFFVAKHLKVGKNYWMAMDYVKKKYKVAMSNELEIKSDESRIIDGIETTLKNMYIACTTKSTCKDHIELLKPLLIEFQQKSEKRKNLNVFSDIAELKEILGDEIYNMDGYK